VASDQLLTRGEVAQLLQVPVATLAAWAYSNTGPRYARLGRHCRYRLEDVLAFVESRMHEPERSIGR
jgi:excisionase family DNA binding protein